MSFPDLRDKKNKLKILILGAYRPPKMLQRLEKLRECLIEKHFLLARLVKDFPDNLRLDDDDDIHFNKKSHFLLEGWAHVPLFIFFLKGKNLGVGNELSYTWLRLPMKTSCSAVFLEKNIDVGTMVRGSVKSAKRDNKLSFETFKDDKELCRVAFGHCRKVLDRLFYYID